MSPNAKYKSWYEYRILEKNKLINTLYGNVEILRCYCEPVYDSDDADAVDEPCFCQKINPDKVLMNNGAWIKPGYERTLRELFGAALSVSADTTIVKKHKIATVY